MHIHAPACHTSFRYIEDRDISKTHGIRQESAITMMHKCVYAQRGWRFVTVLFSKRTPQASRRPESSSN